MQKTRNALRQRTRRQTVQKLHGYQHEYSQFKLTESTLLAAVNKIKWALQNREIHLGTFIDTEGALDKTNFCSRVIIKQTTKWMEQWQVVYATCSNKDLWNTECNGSEVMPPKRRVLSPLLWNFVVNDLIDRLNRDHFYTVG